LPPTFINNKDPAAPTRRTSPCSYRA
jgi:hypothetical protein